MKVSLYPSDVQIPCGEIMHRSFGKPVKLYA